MSSSLPDFADKVRATISRLLDRQGLKGLERERMAKVLRRDLDRRLDRAGRRDSRRGPGSPLTPAQRAVLRRG